MEKIKNYLILGLAIALGIMIYLNTRPEVIPEPVTITIPGSQGTSGLVIIDTVKVIKEVPIYIEGEGHVVVDSLYKKEYEQAIKDNNALKAKNLFLESIQIKEYNEIAIDNDTIKIDLYAKTRGSLLAYKIDYDIKNQSFTYTPEVVRVRPKVTLLLGLEAMIAQEPQLKFDAYLQGQEGHAWGVGINTQGDYYIGYKHTISFRKNKK